MARRDWLHRAAWFLALWLAGVGVLGAVAFVLRGILTP